MNEIRDLIIGIDFGKENTQLCYYDRKADEPRSLSMKVGANVYEAPTALCVRPGQTDFTVGIEAEYFAREKNGELIDNLYEVSGTEKPVQVLGESREPWELAAGFIKGMLRYLGVMEIIRNTRCLCIATPELTDVRVKNLKHACSSLGLPEDRFLLMDYGESFYYYVMTQKKEIVNRSVAWYTFNGNAVTFRKLSVNNARKPVLVRLEEPAGTDLPEAARERDSAFCAFIQKTLGTELFSSIQISGEGFDTDWAKQAVKLLCFQKRKVFYGNNLHAGGACAAGKERMEDRNLKNIRFLSESTVKHDVGMEMLVMGSPAYVPLITNGGNWYECSSSCELILNKTEDLVFVVLAMGETEKKRVVMHLPGLPARPDKTTRLLLEMAYVSPDRCRITVTDLGFGDMFPSSGKVWKETVNWTEEGVS